MPGNSMRVRSFSDIDEEMGGSTPPEEKSNTLREEKSNTPREEKSERSDLLSSPVRPGSAKSMISPDSPDSVAALGVSRRKPAPADTATNYPSNLLGDLQSQDGKQKAYKYYKEIAEYGLTMMGLMYLIARSAINNLPRDTLYDDGYNPHTLSWNSSVTETITILSLVATVQLRAMYMAYQLYRARMNLATYRAAKNNRQTDVLFNYFYVMLNQALREVSTEHDIQEIEADCALYFSQEYFDGKTRKELDDTLVQQLRILDKKSVTLNYLWTLTPITFGAIVLQAIADLRLIPYSIINMAAGVLASLVLMAVVSFMFVETIQKSSDFNLLKMAQNVVTGIEKQMQAALDGLAIKLGKNLYKEIQKEVQSLDPSDLEARLTSIKQGDSSAFEKKALFFYNATGRSFFSQTVRNFDDMNALQVYRDKLSEIEPIFATLKEVLGDNQEDLKTCSGENEARLNILLATNLENLNPSLEEVQQILEEILVTLRDADDQELRGVSKAIYEFQQELDDNDELLRSREKCATIGLKIQ